jgi:tRNA pseudouridine65 synthase
MELLKTLYRDEWLVAVDKPSGLLVHRSRISRDHVVALQLVRDQVGQFVYPVHRLDRPTSGVLLFALDSGTAARLKVAWDNNSVSKRYLAVVRGHTDESGSIDRPLREDAESSPAEAVTRYRRLATAEIEVKVDPHPTSRYSLLEAVPVTGRMHQIRKHFKHISHPIIGDKQHGDRRHNLLFRERFAVNRLLLFAQSLRLEHPHTSAVLEINADLPDEFANVFQRLGWQSADSCAPRHSRAP